MKKALVILSGGQDSTTCLFWAKERYDEIHAITFDYGQRHRIEIEAAIKVAEMAEVASHEIVPVPNCLVSSSPLTSENELQQYEDMKDMEAKVGDKREDTFVPMRNALFLVIAANRAEAKGFDALVTGVCQLDSANYDDCRGIFIYSAGLLINIALGHDHRGTNKIIVEAPLLQRTKAETVRLAYDLPGCWEAMAYTHTSYDGRYPPTDKNHANLLRASGFEEAGLPDPLVVRAWREGLMDLPRTHAYEFLREEKSLPSLIKELRGYVADGSLRFGERADIMKQNKRIEATRYHDISVGHRVYGHESKCAHLHGHNYRIHFTVVAEELDSVGRVMDFSVIKEKLCMWLEDNWDHKFLVYAADPWYEVLHKLDPAGVEAVDFNPTAENMAEYLVAVIGPSVLEGTGVTLTKAVVEETRKCSSSYSILNP